MRTDAVTDAIAVVAVAAAVWAAILGAATSLANARGVVFAGGPVILLAGLHPRVWPYLHAPRRLARLPTPTSAAAHFADGGRGHRRALVITVVLGAVAIGIGAAVGLPEASRAQRVGLVVDWLWLGLTATLVEPTIAGASAYLGRRFPERSSGHAVQRSLGGGWTLPEAVVHLYAPAIGVGLAAAAAMPGQLTIDRWVDGEAPTVALGLVTAAGLIVAAAAGWAARPLFARGVFEAVPWVAEATRTLAGPPIPEPSPRFVTAIGRPTTRLWLLQFWRLTPVPGLRFLALVGAAIWVWLSAAPMATGASVAAAVAALWLLPARAVRSARPQRARVLGALPLPAIARTGRDAVAVAVVWLPAAALVVVAAVRYSWAT